MKPDDASPLWIVPRERAVLALVTTLAARVTITHREFLRGDMCVREHVAEELLDLRPGTLRKREQLGTLIYTVRREGNRRWFSLFEIADGMLDRKSGKDVK